MAEQPIQRPRETWFVTNVSNNSVRITDVPSIPVIKPGQRIDLLLYATLNTASGSSVLASYISNGSIITEEYLHTHDDKADLTLVEPLISGGNADDEHKHSHNNLEGLNEDDYIHLTELGNKDFITLTDDSNADDLHKHSHNNLEGLNEDDYIHLTSSDKVDFSTLTDGSNADDLHTHEGTGGVTEHNELEDIQGGTSNSFFHLTETQHDTLTDGSNADSLHTHSGGGSVPDHDDLEGLNDGEYQHLTSAEKDNFNTLTDDSDADSLHKHNHSNLTGIGVNDHHAQEHTIVSHDTNATGSELNTLTFGDSSDADSLHTHNSKANESITLTAGSGITGGGDLSINRSFALDINGLSVDTIGSSDTIPFYDGANKKITFANFTSPLVLRDEWAQSGFDDINGTPFSDVSISWDDSTQELSISPTGSDFSYYIEGVRYTESGTLTKALTDDETGLWIFYIESEGTLSTIKDPNETDIHNIVVNQVIVAYVYWNTSPGFDDGRLGYELHGSRMSPATHIYLHNNVGANYFEGMAVDDILTVEADAANGDADVDAEFSISAGVFFDEDITNEVIAIIAKGDFEIWYLVGNDWQWDETPSDWVADKSYSVGNRVLAISGNAQARGLIFECTTPGLSGGSEPIWQDSSGAVDSDGGDPVGYTTNDNAVVWTCIGSTHSPVKNFLEGDDRLAWNDSGSQTEVTNNDLVLSHIFATNITEDDGTSPKYIAIQGQAVYTTPAQARAGAEVEINNLVYGDLPLQEIVPVATMIFQTGNGYINHSKARIRNTDSGDKWIDWRTTNLKASGGFIAGHGSLSGLTNDDHPQYLALIGRSDQVVFSDITFPTNNNIYFGTNQETFITYDGTDLVIGFSDPSSYDLDSVVRFNDDVTVEGILTVGTSSIQIDGDNSIISSSSGTISIDSNLDVNDDLSVYGDLDVDGELTVQKGLIVNEGGTGGDATSDFRVETLGYANALLVDASADTITSEVPITIDRQAGADGPPLSIWGASFVGGSALVQIRLGVFKNPTNVNFGGFSVAHWDSSEEDIQGLYALTLQSSGETTLGWGGGSTSLNAATKHQFYTAADQITLVGTSRFEIRSDGTCAFLGDAWVESNSNKLYFGGNQETFITYDGTDLVIGFSDPSSYDLDSVIRFNDDVTVEGILTAGNIYNDTDSTYDIGEDLVRYANVWTDAINDYPISLGATVNTISAEESGAISTGTSNGRQFSYGNGNAGNYGTPMDRAGQVVAMSIEAEISSSATGKIQIMLNGTAQGSGYEISTPGTANGSSVVTFATPLDFEAGDVIGFITTSSEAGTNGVIMTMFIEFPFGGGLVGPKGEDGEGDVNGPNGSSLNGIATYADSTGKEIKNIGVTLTKVSNYVTLDFNSTEAFIEGSSLIDLEAPQINLDGDVDVYGSLTIVQPALPNYTPATNALDVQGGIGGINGNGGGISLKGGDIGAGDFCGDIVLEAGGAGSSPSGTGGNVDITAGAGGYAGGTDGTIRLNSDVIGSGDIQGATLTAVNGFTGTGAYTNFTIVDGIIISASL